MHSDGVTIVNATFTTFVILAVHCLQYRIWECAAAKGTHILANFVANSAGFNPPESCNTTASIVLANISCVGM